MRITAVEEYGLRCLLALARKGPKGQLSISEIATAEGLSVPYASKLLAILRRSGLVLAARGRGGGFSITREPSDINLYEALSALGGPLIDPTIVRSTQGNSNNVCTWKGARYMIFWGGLAGYVQDFLSRTSILDLLNSEKASQNQRDSAHVAIAQSLLEKELSRSQAGRTNLE